LDTALIENSLKSNFAAGPPKGGPAAFCFLGHNLAMQGLLGENLKRKY